MCKWWQIIAIFVVLDWTRFCSYFLWVSENTITPPQMQQFFFIIFSPSFFSLKYLGMFGYLQTTTCLCFLRLLFPHIRICVICRRRLHALMNCLPLPWEIFTRRTLYITSKRTQNTNVLSTPVGILPRWPYIMLSEETRNSAEVFGKNLLEMSPLLNLNSLQVFTTCST